MSRANRLALTLVVNGAANRGRAGQLTEAVADRLAAGGARVHTIALDTAEATGQAIAEAVRVGTDGVVTIGGDGLVQIAVQHLAGTPTPLGLIPAGSGNDIAAAFGIPADPMAASDVVTTGMIRRVDAARSGDRWWTSVLCAGFDSAVNERGNAMHWPRGPRRYDVALLRELAALSAQEFEVRYDDQVWTGPAILVAIGNTGQYGGGYRMVAQADPADGLLDVTVVGSVGRAELVRMVPKVKAGRHLSHPAVTRLRAARVSVAADGVVGYADGERIGPLPLDATCVAGALRLWVPA